MKIAIVTHFPDDPACPRGGVEAVSVTLTRALAALEDLEVHVVTTTPNCPAVTTTTWGRVTVHRLRRLGRRMLSGALGPGRRHVSGYLRALAPDVVHAHDTYGLMVKGLAVPRVFTIHGFIYGDTLVSGERLAWLRSRIWRWVETAAWADQPHIISISPYVRERLTGIATGVIHDIDNPIAESFFSTARDEQRGVIFSAALICPRKNTLGLIDALARVRAAGVDAVLRLAGAVTDADYGRRVEERIQHYGLASHVTRLGAISSDQIATELSRASLFALVSLEENAPMGIAEAMAVGLPVVTSNRCGMPYMVQSGETGFLVNPLDAEDIARRLQAVLADDGLREAMGRAARVSAQQRFHPARVAQRTRDVYQEAMRQPRLAAPCRQASGQIGSPANWDASARPIASSSSIASATASTSTE
jgi:glycosyltransferase involved in cell wall biosynthesis